MQGKPKSHTLLTVIVLFEMLMGASVLTLAQPQRPPGQPHRSFPPARQRGLPPDAQKAFRATAIRMRAANKETRQLMAQGRLAEAETMCYRLIALSPTVNGEPLSLQGVQLLGDIYLEQKRYREAIQTYDRVRKGSRDVELDLNTALAYVKLGDLKRARKYYSEDTFFNVTSTPKRKANLYPQLPGTQNAEAFEASLYFARGCEKSSYVATDEAVKDYKKVLSLYPHNGMVAYHAAQQLARVNRYEEALPFWKLAAKYGEGEQARKAKVRIDTWYAFQRQKAKK